MSVDAQNRLEGAPWTVTENAFSDRSAEFPGMLTFTGDQLRLDAPCNFFVTRIVANDGALTIFPFETMPKTCGPEAMEVEGALQRVLLRVTQYEVSGNTLTLSAPDGKQMIKAQR